MKWIAFLLAALMLAACTSASKRYEERQRAKRQQIARIRCDPERHLKEWSEAIPSVSPPDPISGLLTTTVMIPSYTASSSTALTWGFGTSSGTSGCGDMAAMRREQERFVVVTWEPLAEDMARGRGDYVASLAVLVGCPPAAKPAFARMAQRHFGELVPAPGSTPEDFLDRLDLQIAEESGPAHLCDWKREVRAGRFSVRE